MGMCRPTTEEIGRVEPKRRRPTVSVIVASSLLPTPQKLKTPFRVAPPYHLARRQSELRPPVVRLETYRSMARTMAPLRNHRHAVRETSSLDAATAPDHRPAPSRSRQRAPRLVHVEWRTSAALRALALLTAKTSERRCRRRRRRPFDASLQRPAWQRHRMRHPQQ